MNICAIATIAIASAYCAFKWEQKYPIAVSKPMGNGIALGATLSRSLLIELPLLNVKAISSIFFSDGIHQVYARTQRITLW